jgi:hypothetical protein
MDEQACLRRVSPPLRRMRHERAGLRPSPGLEASCGTRTVRSPGMSCRAQIVSTPRIRCSCASAREHRLRTGGLAMGCPRGQPCRIGW